MWLRGVICETPSRQNSSPVRLKGFMKTPAALQPLIDDGVIDEVLRSLKSGKEATVYLVRAGAHTRCAKVYRDMRQRSFQNFRETARRTKQKCGQIFRHAVGLGYAARDITVDLRG